MKPFPNHSPIQRSPKKHIALSYDSEAGEKIRGGEIILNFDEVASVAEEGENAAIVRRAISSLQMIRYKGSLIKIESALLEGHRFAIKHIREGEGEFFFSPIVRRGMYDTSG